MEKSEYERLKEIALDKLSEKRSSLPTELSTKDINELILINEIYQAELEAQNEELQSHISGLEEAQDELRILFDNAPIAYMLMSNKFEVLRANKEVHTMFTLSSFLSGRVPFHSHLYKAHLRPFLDWINNKNKEHTPLEVLLKTKNGYRYCSLNYHRWAKHDSDTFLLSIADIHAQREQSDRFKALFENSQQGVIYLDEDQVIVNLNYTAARIVASQENCISKKFSDLNLIFRDSDQQVISIEELPFAKAIKTELPQPACVYAVDQPGSDEAIWINMEATPHFSVETQALMGVFCIFTDVTKEYLLSQELNHQLENFTKLGDNIPDTILRVDADQKIIYANKKAYEFLSLRPEDLESIKVCELPLFTNENAQDICSILNDLGQLNIPFTCPLSHKLNQLNKDYFVRIIPENTNNHTRTFLIIIEDITERVTSEAMFNQLFFHASDPIILADHTSGIIQSVNDKARKLLKFPDEADETYTFYELFKTFESQDHYDQYIQTLNRFGVASHETMQKSQNDEIQYFQLFCSLINIGGTTYHQSIIHDITERKLLELQMEQASKTFEHTAEGILITKLDGTIISVNETFTQITGYTKEEVIGQKPSILHSGRQDENFYERMWSDLKKNGSFKGEIWNKKKDGTIFPEWIAISPIFDENNEPIQYVAVFSDFSEIKKTQSQLEHLAHYDTLTKLPNRFLLHEQIKRSISAAKRDQYQFAVLFIDLDRFKQINDTYGHKVGDEVLKITASRLQSTLRSSDIVSRLGGDEFVVVLNELHNIESIHSIASSILEKLNQPYNIDDHNHYLSGSIGISIYPEDTDDDDISLLLKHADIAMYESKKAGKNNYHIFSNSMAEAVKKVSLLHNDLNVALSNDEFYLLYQPQYDIVQERIIGFEALIRWQHPLNGVISPDQFIAYAEESKLIIPMGRFVIEQAIKDHAKIAKVLDTAFSISVNVSHVQINQAFVDYLKDLISEHDDLANILKLEITETSVMKNLTTTQTIIRQIKELGFKISLDDFGTGYSALNAIKTLHIDEIKIDRSFVQDVPGDKDDEELISIIIAMAKIMKKTLVAEGVEEARTRDFLADKECPVIQGYLIARPMVIDDVITFIHNTES